jgi:hypothetical protein
VHVAHWLPLATVVTPGSAAGIIHWIAVGAGAFVNGAAACVSAIGVVSMRGGGGHGSQERRTRNEHLRRRCGS